MTFPFDWIAFDADDTLWRAEYLYRAGIERLDAILARYGVMPGSPRQQEIEIANLQIYGYGVSGFVFSLIETAIELTGGKVSGADIHDLVRLSKEMLSAPLELSEHAAATVAALAGRCPLLLVTKGDLRHQNAKVAASGLKDFFQAVEVVADKTPAVYSALMARHRIRSERFLMVGDSLRSDILPVLELGGWAAHIPPEHIWDHEHSHPVQADHPRFVQLEHLGLLPGWIESLNGRVPK